MKLLLVEDDEILSEDIKQIIEKIGEVTQSFDGSEGLYEAETGIYDLIVLDLMLPEMNGYEVLQTLREEKIMTPVLILTAKDGIEDRLNGFQKGTDDYLVKPFHRDELLMRLQAILKRTYGLYSEDEVSYEAITCHLIRKEVTFEGEILPIYAKEFDLLVYLIQNQGNILTKDQIFDRIWGFDSDTTLTVVEVYMSNLRKHLRITGLDQHIKTLRNVGYLMKG